MRALADPYVYVWVYEVSPERVDDFCELYGPDGAWVALFRRASGYVGTELIVDREHPDRFVSIDRWESEGAFRDFRAGFATEFERLDCLGDEMTVRETLLGEFTTSSTPSSG